MCNVMICLYYLNLVLCIIPACPFGSFLSCVHSFCYFIIGVNYLQHRVVTGSFSRSTIHESCRGSPSQKCDVKLSRNDQNYMSTLYVVFACILYSYILCFVLAGAVANYCDNAIRDTHNNNIQYHRAERESCLYLLVAVRNSDILKL